MVEHMITCTASVAAGRTGCGSRVVPPQLTGI